MRWQHTIGLIVLGALLLGYSQPASAAGEQCFAETGFCVGGRFLEYWQQNGGLAVFGYPTGPAQPEQNRDTGQTYLTQWFERNRFELHPENKRPYDVLLGRLGDDLLRQQGIDWQQQPRENGPRAGCLWFEQTGHNVCDQSGGLGFKSYWQGHGLSDPALTSAGRSLALFGLPLTEARPEANSSGDILLTQWFERARFEWHPDKPDQYKVLLGLLGHEAHLTTSGLNGSIAFVQSQDIFSGGNLYRMRADGSQAAALSAQANLFLDTAEFAWSPSGDRVAYTSGTKLVVANADGSAATAVAQQGVTSPNMARFAQTWSPDGAWLAYVQAGDLYATRLDGQPAVRITRSGDVDGAWPLSWSPAGYLAYTASGHIWRVKSDGSQRADLGPGIAPIWSPDGATLAFALDGGIWLSSADGSGRRSMLAARTTATGNPTTFAPGSWSPDGRYLLAVGGDAYNSYARDIYRIEPATGQVVQLTKHPDLDDSPSWSPDGQYIVFASKRSRRYELYVMRADGTGQTRLPTSMEASTPRWT